MENEDINLVVNTTNANAATGGNALDEGRVGTNGLQTKGIHVWFGKHHVLEDISLDFPANSVTGLIGPYCSGKSTFLRVLNRMHEFIPGAAMDGEVFLDGEEIYGPKVDVTAMRLKVGMVFQKPNPFPSMTIAENVLAGLKLANIKVQDKDSLLEECLNRAGLWKEVKDRLKLSGSSLSGGQQQRLCIARALAVKPKVLLMDEPCSALDPASTLKVEETIVQLSNDMTIVVVTHNMQQAARESEYTGFFYADPETGPGRSHIIEFGETDQIFNNPTNTQTADYVAGRFG
jgi:phosphate transport system ATP-binding protein